MTYYKIRHRVTGLYSKGGVYVPADGTGYLWSKVGKVWTSLGVLRSHITTHLTGLWQGAPAGTDMSDWEVVEYEVLERSAKPIHEMVSPKKLIQMLKA